MAKYFNLTITDASLPKPDGHLLIGRLKFGIVAAGFTAAGIMLMVFSRRYPPPISVDRPKRPSAFGRY